MDKLEPEKRSRNMSRIRSKNTKPELAVRRLIFSLGYRYRLHAAALPGKPDIVFPRRRAVIFVHGCFWHLHSECNEGRSPRTRQEYWGPKLRRNVERDRETVANLLQQQWKVLEIWECQIKNEGDLKRRVRRFLGSSSLDKFATPNGTDRGF